jgi:hypothetical protein
MNFRKDREIIKGVFGELTDSEMSRLSRKIQHDPAAQVELKSYEEVARSLNLLREVPPDQLSKDRLRHAILERGLSPALEPEPRRNWIWMPVSAFLLALLLVTVPRLQRQSEPVVVLKKDQVPRNLDSVPSAEDKKMASNRNEFVDGPDFVGLIPSKAFMASMTRDESKPSQRLPLRSSTRKFALPTAQLNANSNNGESKAEEEQGPGAAVPKRDVSAAIVDAGMPVGTAANERSGFQERNAASSQIVLISENVGAPAKATEMEAFSGVLVGG